MAQKSLLSFFKTDQSKDTTKPSPSEIQTDVKRRRSDDFEDGSPVKRAQRCKIQRITDSDSDTEIEDRDKRIDAGSGNIDEKEAAASNSNDVVCHKSGEEESSPSKELSDSDKSPQTDRAEPLQNKVNAEPSRQPQKPLYSIFVSKKNLGKNKLETNDVAKEKIEGAANADKKSGFVGFKSDQNKTNGQANNYNPAKVPYHPINDACWKRGEKVPYLALARTLEEIEKVSSRLKMIEVLANFLRSVLVLTPDDLLQAVYLCLNKVGPDYEGLELGIGDMILMKSLAQATGRTVDKIKAEVNVKGDLGIVAENSRGTQRTMFTPPKLTLCGVFTKLKEIAKMSGNAAQSKKTDIIKGMLVACRHSEARYLVRSLSGKLRIGLAEQSILAALAQACVLTPPGQTYPPEIIDTSHSEGYKKKLESSVLTLKTTYCECPNYDKIIQVLLDGGIESLPEKCKLTPGVPLKPMLAHPTKGVEEVLRRFENAKFTCEFKYDGERAQIHVVDGNVYIYSRNQENNTSKYPDIIARIPHCLNPATKSCILDTEAVAWDREKKQILPFQVLSTRKRKDASESEIKVQVCVFVFDLLYLNGESLVKKSLRERRTLLREAIKEVEGEFCLVTSQDAESLEHVQEFLEESIKANCEGLMVKTLDVDATYEIAKRSHNWLKVKKDYLEGLGDTVDAVVIGAYYGKGKRTGNYGGFLLACYDDENEEFQTLCKLGTGFTEEQLEKHTSFLKQHIIDKPKSYYRYDSSLQVDVWFEPVQVWEIKCADLSVSPVHKAGIGLVDPVKGISLRFPRFIRIRDDKSPENATTSSQVADLYKNQEQVKSQTTDTKDCDLAEEY